MAFLRNHAPARLHIVERHIDRLDDIGQREAVANIFIALHVALEALHIAQQGGIFEDILVPAFEHDNQGFNAAEEPLNFKVSLVIGRIQVQQRGAGARIADGQVADLGHGQQKGDNPEHDDRPGVARNHNPGRACANQILEPALLSFNDFLSVRGSEVVVDDRVEQQLTDRHRGDPDGGRNGDPLQNDHRHDDDHQHAQRVGNNTAQGRHEQLGKG